MALNKKAKQLANRKYREKIKAGYEKPSAKSSHEHEAVMAELETARKTIQFISQKLQAEIELRLVREKEEKGREAKPGWQHDSETDTFKYTGCAGTADFRRADNDSVNSPRHYTQHPSGIETIQITEWFNFNRGSAIEHIWRADEKGSTLEDLRKAQWYIGREIYRLEKERVK